MNIKSKPGTEVKFVGVGGYDSDVPNALKAGLIVGRTYSVKYVEINDWSSYVELEGIEGKFNTVMFA